MLTIELFEAVSSQDHEEIAAEGERLLTFAEPDAKCHEIIFTGAE